MKPPLYLTRITSGPTNGTRFYFDGDRDALYWAHLSNKLPLIPIKSEAGERDEVKAMDGGKIYLSEDHSRGYLCIGGDYPLEEGTATA
jgi:hypothetical protein